jgi:poly(3-hydroxybutyrate) depolymerase
MLHEYDLEYELNRINADLGVSLTFGSNFKIKFSQYDDRAFPEKGWAIDRVQLTDQQQFYVPSLENDIFHRLSVPGEDDADFFYHIGVFGSVDANTPILVSVHGLNRRIGGYTHDWERYAVDPAHGVGDLIVVAPYFHDQGQYAAMQSLAWGHPGRTADAVLLDLVDHVADTVGGDPSRFYLYGHSAGGQFVERFTWAHPDRVAAVVVSGPGSHTFPDPTVPFTWGTAPNPSLPAPAGINLEANTDAYVATRVMYFVGDDDDEPIYNEDPAIAAQGLTRLHRALNMYEAVHDVASARGLSPTHFQSEIWVDENQGHGHDPGDMAEMYEFLFRDVDPPQSPVRIHPRVVVAPTTDERRATLPQGVDRVNPNSNVYLELWVESTASAFSPGISAGSVEIYFDAALLNAVGIEHSTVFDRNVTGTINAAADDGRILDLGGETLLTGVGIDEYALLARVRFATTSPADPAQIAVAVHRDGRFQLEDGSSRRTDALPVPRVDIAPTTAVHGIVFNDANGDGVHNALETGLRRWNVALQQLDGADWVTADTGYLIEPDRYSTNNIASHALPQATLGAVGGYVQAPQVAVWGIDPDPAVADFDGLFAWWDTDGWHDRWRNGQSELRVDFASPTSYVRLEARGGSSSGRAWLRAFNSDDTLVAEEFSSLLAPSATDSVLLNRSTADIAYVIVTSEGTAAVGLEDLEFLAPLTTLTDDEGYYELTGLDFLASIGASHRVVASLKSGWEWTAPAEGRLELTLQQDAILDGANIGAATLGSGAPDLLGTSFAVTPYSVRAGGGEPTASFTVRNNTFRAAGAFNVRFFLSQDADIDPATDLRLVIAGDDPHYGDRSDHAAVRLGGLARFEEVSETVRLAVPGADPFGGGRHYYLGMVVDADDEVDEGPSEANNRNRQSGLDLQAVSYAIPAPFPLVEDWESGAFPAAWEWITAATGRVEVTSEHGPFLGSYHAVVEDALIDTYDSVNQLILHIDMTGVPEALVSFANREWYDPDSEEDLVEYSLDGGSQWTELVSLTADHSSNVYQTQRGLISALGAETPADVMVRFQHRGALPAPWGGMAFDEIRVSEPLPDLVTESFAVVPGNLQTADGQATATFTVRNVSLDRIFDSFNVRFYLSEDRRIDPAEDVLLQLDPSDLLYDSSPDHSAARKTGLNIDTDWTASVLLTVPASDPFEGGNHYYIGMVVDADGEIDESREDNNTGRGAGIDLDDAVYVAPATTPVAENWESGQFADFWEVVAGTEGRVGIRSDYDPYEGTRHLLMDDASLAEPESINQLILHANLAGQSGIELSFATRQWHDEDDLEDEVEISTDGGATWHTVFSLRDTQVGDHYERHVVDLDHFLDFYGGVYSADTLVRFQQRARSAVPSDGLGLDDIRLGHESVGPRVVDFRPLGLFVPPGADTIRFEFDQEMAPASFDWTDVVDFTGPDGDRVGSLINYAWIAPKLLELTTAPMDELGVYQILIGPQITDRNGNAMDQDGDLRGGESADRFGFTFQVAHTLHFADMETDPGWSLDPGSAPYRWERGKPMGGGSQVPGPTDAISGENVLGYNLAGDYANGMSAQYATSPAIDATGFEHVVAAFHGWLDVDAFSRDQARMQVSNDGLTWFDRFVNPDFPLLQNRWNYHLVNISPVADHQPTVYLRFVMGPTDGAVVYDGWSIDDVLVTGVPIDTTLPAIEVRDSEGAPADYAVDFGDVDVLDDSRSYQVTVTNRGTSQPLLIDAITLSDSENFSITWDGDGSAPTSISAGGSRVAAVTFDPAVPGSHAATLRIDSNDPDGDERRIEIDLSGAGTTRPGYAWTRTIGGSVEDLGFAVTTDASRNVYVTGAFEGSVDFDPTPSGTDRRTSAGSRDIFVTKFAPDGDYLWTWTAGGTLSDQGFAITVDREGDVIVAGEFRRTVDFNESPIDVDNHTALGFGDVFVVKLTPDGNHKWARSIGGTDSDDVRDVAIDKHGRIYLTGSFRGAPDFDPTDGVDQRAAIHGADVFVTSLDPYGGYLWTRTIGGLGTQLGEAIDVDDAGTIFMAGDFVSTVDFDPTDGVDLHTANGNVYDVFVTSLTRSGDYNWTYTFGGPDDDELIDLALDEARNVYVTGGFELTTDFDSGIGSDVRTAVGGSDVFVTKLLADGSYVWTRAFGGPGADYGYGVAATGDDLFVAGSFQGTIDLDPSGAADLLTSVGGDDAFLFRLGSDGSYIWTDRVGGASSDLPLGITVDMDGMVYYTGAFHGLVDFNPTVTATDFRQAVGAFDMFLGKWGPEQFITDHAPPTSSVTGLPATLASTRFLVRWSGEDDAGGSGIGSYDVYVAENGGPPTLWRDGATSTQETFVGVAGRHYAFFSVATDNTGNVESLGASPDAETTLSLVEGDFSADNRVGLIDLAILRGHFGSTGDAAIANGDLDGNGTIDRLDLARFVRFFGRRMTSPSAQPAPAAVDVVHGEPPISSPHSQAASRPILRGAIRTSRPVVEEPGDPRAISGHRVTARNSRRLRHSGRATEDLREMDDQFHGSAIRRDG